MHQAAQTKNFNFSKLKIKLMWNDRRIKEPTHDGLYIVYGIFNKGTFFETKRKSIQYWDNEAKIFVDADGEDLIGINEAVEYWLDVYDLPNPE